MGGEVSVRAFAAPDVTDWTAAFAAAASTGKRVLVPPGRYYGTFDLDLRRPSFVGAGRESVTIAVAPGHYFLDSNQLWAGLRVEGMVFRGGSGAIRNRYAGSNVTTFLDVADCEFRDYDTCAISSNSSDGPFWRIRQNLFSAANQTTAIGVALNGLTDATVIADNEWQRNLVDIKLALGGNNAYVRGNDFVHYGAAEAGLSRASIWIVPNPSPVNAGAGLLVEGNKFGNEKLGPDDKRILYADELPGDTFGERLPNLDVDSSGYITGHTFRDNLVNGGAAVPVVYSTTPNLRSSIYGPITLAGTEPSAVVEFRTPPTGCGPEAATNVLGPVVSPSWNSAPLTASNAPGLFRLDDPHQMFEASVTAPTTYRGGSRATGFTRLLAQRVNGFSLGGGATKTAVTDAVGAADAVDVLLGAGSIYGYVPGPDAVRVGEPIWVEFDVKQSDVDPVTRLQVLFGLDTAAPGAACNFLRRHVEPGTEWKPYRFLTYSGIASPRLVLKFARSSGATGTGVQLGGVRMYHAREPIPADLVLPDATTTPGDSQWAGYVVATINGTPRRIPYL